MSDIRINALATTASTTASDDYIAIDGSANGTRKLSAYSPTFGGNLTVSGTGTSTFAGPITGATLAPGVDTAVNYFSAFGATTGWPFRISTIYDANYVDQYITLNGTLTGTRATPTFTGAATGGGYIRLNGQSAQVSIGTYAGGAGASIVPAAYFSGGNTTLAGNLTVSGTGTSSVAGTFLLGTTTDSSNGKLQLATHTTSAGGIGFGTDTSLFRTASGNLGVYGSGTDSRINFSHSTSTANKGLDVQLDTLKDGYVWLRENRNLYFGTNNTTALTLDSSQNATFAGTVRINGANSAFGGAIQTGIGVTQLGDVGTFTYTNADSWIGGRFAPERAGTTGVGYGLVSQLRVSSGTQTYGVGVIVEAPGGGGAVTNFQNVRIGGRDAVTGNFAIWDNSGYDSRLSGTIITQNGVASTPASASASGTAGMIKWDASYIYVCTATNTWKRAAIATW